jgi:hypothetical protein
MAFKPNKKLKQGYKRLFKRDPLGANMFLLLCEFADKNGQVPIRDERELAELIAVRFENPEAYQL